MKGIFLTFMVLSIISCSTDDTLKSLAVDTATGFVSEKIDSAVVVTDNNGVVSIGDEMVRYVIDPKNVYYGEIDEFPGADMLVTIDSLHDPYLMPAWHLILDQDRDKLIIKAAIRSDLRVLSINKGIITSEIPTHDPSSPLYYCSECRDTVDYRIAGGRFELVTSDE